MPTDGLPKLGGGVRLRILFGELTVVLVYMCRDFPYCGVDGPAGGMTLTDAAGERLTGYVVVVTVGIRLTDAPPGIMLTDAPGDMQAEPQQTW